MATSRGTSVNATSTQRRSATNRINAINTSDRMPAWRNALITVVAASMMVRLAGSLRGDTAHGHNEATQDSVVVAIPLRRDLDPDPAVGRHPVSFQRGRKSRKAHGFGIEEIPHLAQRRPQWRDERAVCFAQDGGRRLRQCGQNNFEAASVYGGWAIEAIRRLGQLGD